VTHPIVDQIRFARSEFIRGVHDLSEADATIRVGPANSISWTVGHLAWQEQRYWLQRLNGVSLIPELDSEYCYGCPPSAPTLATSLERWNRIVAATDPHLDAVTEETLGVDPVVNGEHIGATFGSMALRVIYHYWFHLGETQGIRQALGHTGLAEYVGDIDEQAPYRR
jgi:hypothetical protein